MNRGVRRFLRWTAPGVGLFAASSALAPGRAAAHFELQSPPAWMSQDAVGSPQKLGPCGDEGGGTATGIVTAVAKGGVITLTIDEKIFHPGHYRVALAVHDRSELPAEPPVTPGVQACGTTTVESPVVFPVLADGVFDHASPFSGPQTIQIPLPADVTCDACTLQVIEFMSDHGLNNPGGCFYHHCATLAIGVDLPDGGGPASTGGAGASGPTGGGNGAGGGSETFHSESSGCGCAVPDGGVPGLGALASGLALLVLARRRRARSS